MGDTPEELLSRLRWDADQIITNHEGERVWLKKCIGGITDCCFTDNPCEYHAKLTHQVHKRVQ